MIHAHPVTGRQRLRRFVDRDKLFIRPLKLGWANEFVEEEETAGLQTFRDLSKKVFETSDMVNGTDSKYHVVVVLRKRYEIEVGDAIGDLSQAGYVRQSSRLSNGTVGKIHPFMLRRKIVLNKAPLELSLTATKGKGALDRHPAAEITFHEILEAISLHIATNQEVQTLLHLGMLRPMETVRRPPDAGARSIPPNLPYSGDVRFFRHSNLPGTTF
jgi:hypothetical protein